MKKNYIEKDCDLGLLPSGLFRLGKSYDQILSDHVLIRKMRDVLKEFARKWGGNFPFEEMIKEAYFQCGIVLNRYCCRDYNDYYYIFIIKERRKEIFNDDAHIRIIVYMVHLLLSTRKNNTDGTAAILDEIETKYFNSRYFWEPENPFQKLVDSKVQHEIDFCVQPLPIKEAEWKDVLWGRLEYVISGDEDDDYNKDTFEDYHNICNGTFDEDAYCKKYIDTIQLIVNAIGFRKIEEQLKLLDIIKDKMTYNVCPKKIPGCVEPCHGCDFPYVCVEDETFSRLHKRSIENIQQSIMVKFSKMNNPIKTSQNSFSPYYKGPLRLNNLTKTDMARFIFIMCRMSSFIKENGESVSDEKVFEYFGHFFNEDFSQLAHSKILMYLAAEKVDGKTFSYPLSAYLSKTTVKETFVA